ncbi:hypothetical protein GQX74_003397 [Glossina fuscipes]|nr:hypothetical protein GQX74_003397 [Glossina fuscipes]
MSSIRVSTRGLLLMRFGPEKPAYVLQIVALHFNVKPLLRTHLLYKVLILHLTATQRLIVGKSDDIERSLKNRRGSALTANLVGYNKSDMKISTEGLKQKRSSNLPLAIHLNLIPVSKTTNLLIE